MSDQQGGEPSVQNGRRRVGRDTDHTWVIFSDQGSEVSAIASDNPAGSDRELVDTGIREACLAEIRGNVLDVKPFVYSREDAADWHLLVKK